MPAISSRMKARNFSVRVSLTSSVRARPSISCVSWSTFECRAAEALSNCADSALSSSASRRSRNVSRSMRDFLSWSMCRRSSVISFTSAAVSTWSFDGSSPRNCAMPFSRALHRRVRDSIEAASFSMRTRMLDCSRSSMSFASCSVRFWTWLFAPTRRLISQFMAFSSFARPSCAAAIFVISCCRRLTVSPSMTLSKPTKRWPTSISLLRNRSRSAAVFSPAAPRMLVESNVRWWKAVEVAGPRALRGSDTFAASPLFRLRALPGLCPWRLALPGLFTSDGVMESVPILRHLLSGMGSLEP
mmetsp:Transcript_17129/g.48728  ORF Transcript_17129/g.48728 Transcript_17129/m.48728 type:complete len:301 (-) Transcript_17129:6-908(-)